MRLERERMRAEGPEIAGRGLKQGGFDPILMEGRDSGMETLT